jgi:hypothetical protein
MFGISGMLIVVLITAWSVIAEVREGVRGGEGKREVVERGRETVNK